MAALFLRLPGRDQINRHQLGSEIASREIFVIGLIVQALFEVTLVTILSAAFLYMSTSSAYG
jgi:hypothetical protein